MRCHVLVLRTEGKAHAIFPLMVLVRRCNSSQGRQSSVQGSVGTQIYLFCTGSKKKKSLASDIWSDMAHRGSLP